MQSRAKDTVRSFNRTDISVANDVICSSATANMMWLVQVPSSCPVCDTIH